MHEAVDIERWKALFPLEVLRIEAREFVTKQMRESPECYPNDEAFDAHLKLMNPGGQLISSPFHLAVVEQLRAEALNNSSYEKVPTDVFLFGKGESSDRAVTKVGGVPFWPAKRKWPVSSSGEPMVFVGQFNFTDSKDIVPELPGDILLIFADGIYSAWKSEQNPLHFEWMDSGEQELLPSTELPSVKWDILPCYGVRHRSVDYIGVEEEALQAYHQPWCIDIFEGTKIGGVPRFIQGSEAKSGKFLCALGSVLPASHPVFHRPFPFVNTESPVDRRSAEARKERRRLLMWGDAGSLYLFLCEDGSVNWALQCY